MEGVFSFLKTTFCTILYEASLETKPSVYSQSVRRSAPIFSLFSWEEVFLAHHTLNLISHQLRPDLNNFPKQTAIPSFLSSRDLCICFLRLRSGEPLLSPGSSHSITGGLPVRTTRTLGPVRAGEPATSLQALQRPAKNISENACEIHWVTVIYMP